MWQRLLCAATSAVLLMSGTCIRYDDEDASESEILNCKKMPLGALMVNTDKARKALVKWRTLPGPPWDNLPANPVFIMLVYGQIAFPKAWEAVFNASHEQEESYKLLVHAKDEISRQSLPPYFKSRLVESFEQTRRCSAVKLILNLLRLCLKARLQASHFIIVSGDSMPTKPLSHMLKDMQIESRSRFCVDNELRRAETFFAMRRDTAYFLTSHFENIFTEIVPATSCPDEDMIYWSAYQRGEPTVNSCIQMSDWSHTDKLWRSNAERCQCPKFLSSFKMKEASCGRPSLWGGVRREGLQDIFASPAGYWLIRKFPGDSLPGSALLIDDANEKESIEVLTNMREKWQDEGLVDFSLLEKPDTDNHEGSNSNQDHSSKGEKNSGKDDKTSKDKDDKNKQNDDKTNKGENGGKETKKEKEKEKEKKEKEKEKEIRLKKLKAHLETMESLDHATAKLINEKRDSDFIPLVVVPDPESEDLQEVRKRADMNPGRADISGFPHWTTFNRIEPSGLVFGKTTGALVTAFD